MGIQIDFFLWWMVSVTAWPAGRFKLLTVMTLQSVLGMVEWLAEGEGKR